MNDILIKLAQVEDLTKDLEETFANLRNYNLKLNPSKCTFGIKSGWFLWYLVIKWGIEAT